MLVLLELHVSFLNHHLLFRVALVVVRLPNKHLVKFRFVQNTVGVWSRLHPNELFEAGLPMLLHGQQDAWYKQILGFDFTMPAAHDLDAALGLDIETDLAVDVAPVGMEGEDVDEDGLDGLGLGDDNSDDEFVKHLERIMEEEEVHVDEAIKS